MPPLHFLNRDAERWPDGVQVILLSVRQRVPEHRVDRLGERSQRALGFLHERDGQQSCPPPPFAPAKVVANRGEARGCEGDRRGRREQARDKPILEVVCSNGGGCHEQPHPC